MTMWRQSVRVVLVLCVVSVGAAVLLGVKDRVSPAPELIVNRTDPEAVIQTRGSRTVQADAHGENLTVVADRQDTYRDGRLRLIENVEVTLSDRENRAGFVLTGSEAALNPARTTVQLIGDVRMKSSDGLSAVTEEASYADADGIIRMPGRTRFTRNGMDASGDGADYDQKADLLQLLSAAQVDLVSDVPHTRIASRTATVAHTDGYMRFEDSVAIDTGTYQITAGMARATLFNGSVQLEGLELTQEARLVRRAQQPGTLREMSASIMELAYSKDDRVIETAKLTGEAKLEIATPDQKEGSRIGSSSMLLSFGSDDRKINELVAHRQVSLILPERLNAPRQTVTAEMLTVTRPIGKTLELARFEGDVKFEEVEDAGGGEPAARVTRAQRLDATLSEGLTRLSAARFIGEVRFDDGRIIGLADEAIYEIQKDQVELLTSGQEARTPRVESSRGSVQAYKITLSPDDNSMMAEGDVESVLTTGPVVDKIDDGRRLPGLLQPIEPVYVTSGHLTYDGNTKKTVYTQDARLWQAATQFDADSIVLEESNGNISAEGDVRTRWLLTQVNTDTGLKEENLTRGRAHRFMYDDALRRTTYAVDARISGSRNNLSADLIRFFLLPDGRTLERIEATGNVELNVPGRLVFGETLVYYDFEGRYVMTGRPVRIIAESEEQCQETTGRTLTFSLVEDAVSVDGESEIRTETSRGNCAELTR